MVDRGKPPEISKRVLILHIGGGKTGSSFVQHTMARFSEQLSARSISYPKGDNHDRAAAGQVTSGNAVWLADFLCDTGDAPAQNEGLERLSLLLTSTVERVLLLSSERLQYFHGERLRTLDELAQKNGFELRVVYFVRSVAGLAMSMYRQRVKRQRETKRFVDWVRRYEYAGLGIVRELEGTLPSDRFGVVNYDFARSALLPALLSAAGVPIDLPVEVTGVDRIVNRSLTDRETELVRVMNSLLQSENQSRFVGESIIRMQAPPGSMTIPASAVDVLRERFEPELHRINKHLSAETAVGILGPSDRVGEASTTALDETELALASVMSALVRRAIK